jgi:hypothetical protein
MNPPGNAGLLAASVDGAVQRPRPCGAVASGGAAGWVLGLLPEPAGAGWRRRPGLDHVLSCGPPPPAPVARRIGP